MSKRKVAGVVLAGGRSSRMGRDKALLDYKGRPLLDHMTGTLKQAGIENIYVSGCFEGYRCIPDRKPHSGPAQAMRDVLGALAEYDGVLFVPVDMPFLSAEMLCLLARMEGGGYFKGYPLPAFIAGNLQKSAQGGSVQNFLAAMKIYPVVLPPELEFCMINANTPEEWREALRA